MKETGRRPGAPWHTGEDKQQSPAQKLLEPGFKHEPNCFASPIQPWGTALKLSPLHRKL